MAINLLFENLSGRKFYKYEAIGDSVESLDNIKENIRKLLSVSKDYLYVFEYTDKDLLIDPLIFKIIPNQNYIVSSIKIDENVFDFICDEFYNGQLNLGNIILENGDKYKNEDYTDYCLAKFPEPDYVNKISSIQNKLNCRNIAFSIEFKGYGSIRFRFENPRIDNNINDNGKLYNIPGLDRKRVIKLIKSIFFNKIESLLNP